MASASAGPTAVHLRNLNKHKNRQIGVYVSFQQNAFK